MKFPLVLCAVALACPILQAWGHPDASASMHTHYMGRLHEKNKDGHEQCVGSFSGTNVYHHHSCDGSWSGFAQRCKDVLGGIVGMISSSFTSGSSSHSSVDLDMKSRIVNEKPKCDHCKSHPCVCGNPCGECSKEPTKTIYVAPHHSHHQHQYQSLPHHHHHQVPHQYYQYNPHHQQPYQHYQPQHLVQQKTDSCDCEDPPVVVETTEYVPTEIVKPVEEIVTIQPAILIPVAEPEEDKHKHHHEKLHHHLHQHDKYHHGHEHHTKKESWKSTS